jgi:cytochrome c553
MFATFIVLFFIPYFHFQALAEENPSKQAPETHASEDIKRGERFFYGLLPRGSESPSCVSCHTATGSDTLNWNPSLQDLTVKFAGKSNQDFIASVKQPSGKLSQVVHQNVALTEDDLQYVKAFLDHKAQIGPTKAKISIDRLLFFLFLGILITLAILDLILFKKIKPRIIPAIILLAGLVGQIYMVSTEAIRLGRQENYAPDQPIKFSHKVHAGQNGIDCMYCHTTAEQSKSAGIPAASLCMNCHVLIREGTNSGKFEIAKVVEANETSKSIEWIRIHNLPDHVFFSHAIHVGSGKLDCATCHGDVKQMDIMKQQNDLSMGWCVNCHRETNVNFKDNGYYDTYIKLHEQLKAGKIDTIKAADTGANDCMKCHY